MSAPQSSLTVHPHGRGEDFKLLAAGFETAGSPPRAWGGRHRAGADLLEERFTPTGVGRTSAGARPRGCTAVHPHGRGEDGRCERDERPVSRFTPTGVGRTTQVSRNSHGSTVHPHGRGED